MKKLIAFASLAAILAVPLAAANQQPTDVPTPVDTTPDATYAAGTTPNTVGDGSNAQGGTPPYFASMPADIPTPNTTGWIVSAPTNANFITIPPGGENKFRILFNSVKTLFDDPIRNFNEPGTSHCHEFFGNIGINAYSTFARLRNRPASTSSGGPVNASGYWVPCLVKTNPFGDGKNYARISDIILIYYVSPLNDRLKTVRIPRGIRMVTGINMDDPDDLLHKSEIAAANAQPGTSSGRYAYNGNGFLGWQCSAGGTTDVGTHFWLKNSDGSDPWAGACTAGSLMVASLDTPECWNGKDPWVPGGYRHMRHLVMDNAVGALVCPKNWYHITHAQIKPQYTVQGFSDYGNTRLSSDNAAGVAAGRTFRNGESFHSDWFPAWHDAALMMGLNQCGGLVGYGGAGVPHECNSSAIGLDTYLQTGTAPDGSRNPQVNPNLSYNSNSASNMYRIRVTAPSGNKTFTTH